MPKLVEIAQNLPPAGLVIARDYTKLYPYLCKWLKWRPEAVTPAVTFGGYDAQNYPSVRIAWRRLAWISTGKQLRL